MGFSDLPYLTDRKASAMPKPQKGSARLERTTNRAKWEKEEAANKKAAKGRDKQCRLPFCPWCLEHRRRGRTILLHGAHVLAAKGMGGDPSLIRSQVDQLMALCGPAHMAQEHGEIDVEPLTDKGTDDACAFYLVRDVIDRQTDDVKTERVLWAREKAVGVPDSAGPLTREFTPLRRAKVQD